MPLLNYTTKVDVEKTVQEIQKILAAHGAQAIRFDYIDGNIETISFIVEVEGHQIPFKLPTNWKPVQGVLQTQKKKNGRIQATEEQARRTAWRVVKDWVEAQMALVEIHMAKMEQIFLPYAMDHSGKTVYEVLMKGEYKHLLLGPQSQHD